MKKVLLIMVAVLMVGCGTTRVDQTDLYGTVEDVLYYNGHHHAKVWCKSKGKYYNITTDKLYQIGDIIRIK